jgi:hypothetical protein
MHLFLALIVTIKIGDFMVKIIDSRPPSKDSLADEREHHSRWSANQIGPDGLKIGPDRSEDTLFVTLSANGVSGLRPQESYMLELALDNQRDLKLPIIFKGNEYHQINLGELEGGQKIVIRRLRESDLAIEYTNVSKVHATISRSANGDLYLEDHNSTNGTFLNGERIRGKVKIEPNDKIRITSWL